jgi:hypothetical protein
MKVLKNEGRQMKTSFSHSLLNKERVLSRLFLACLVQDHDTAMAFLQESELSRSNMLCLKCLNPMKCAEPSVMSMNAFGGATANDWYMGT